MAKNWLPLLQGFDFVICRCKFFRKSFPVCSCCSTGVNYHPPADLLQVWHLKRIIVKKRDFCLLNFKLNWKQHDSPSCGHHPIVFFPHVHLKITHQPAWCFRVHSYTSIPCFNGFMDIYCFIPSRPLNVILPHPQISPFRVSVLSDNVQ